jgi:hypothetical protein
MRKAKSAFEAEIMDQADPLLIKKPEGWKFYEKLIINAEYDEKWKGHSFFPAIVMEQNKSYTPPMVNRYFAILDHWRKIATSGSYLLPNYFTPDGEKLKRREGGELNEVISDAFQKYGKVITVMYVLVNEKNHHHIHAKSLKLAYKRYGHLFVPEFIELAKHQQKERKSKINIFE